MNNSSLPDWPFQQATPVSGKEPIKEFNGTHGLAF
jgi:hypothetical protein